MALQGLGEQHQLAIEPARLQPLPIVGTRDPALEQDLLLRAQRAQEQNVAGLC